MGTNYDFEVKNYTYFSCTKTASDYWFTQKSMSVILKVTPQNITIHLKELQKFRGRSLQHMEFPVTKQEGFRTVIRNLKH